MRAPRVPHRLLASMVLLPGLLSGAATSWALEAVPARVQGDRLLAPDGSWHALADLGLESVSATAPLADGFLVAGELEAMGGRGLTLVRVDGSGAERLPPLPARAPALREPLPLVSSRGDLVGAAWLEGTDPRRLAVRFAAWDGTAWEPPEEVAAPGPGSQLALTGTVLRDGSVLLTWTAFDGEDDEVEWSRREGAIWTPPRRLAGDNSVPDITPALHASSETGSGGDEALAVWSRYLDGEYRVMLSRFDGRSWSEPRPVGPPGSVFPGFEPISRISSRSEGGARILFRTASPRGWQTVELARDGRPLRTARVRAETSQRPRLIDGGDGLRFAWPSPEEEPGDPLGPSIRTAAWENLP